MRVQLSPRSLCSLLLLFPPLLQLCNCDAKCYVCDNYFEINVRNKDPNMAVDLRRRYCSVNSLPAVERQSECIGKDYNGCVKIVSKSWRHHIDKAGVGMRSDDTLIGTVVTRDCADVPPGLGFGCHLLTGAGTTTEMCYCRGEYCNSGVGLRLGGWPVLLLIFVPFAVWRAFTV